MSTRTPAPLVETNNVRAIGLITLSMALFVVEDMFIKMVSGPLSAPLVMVYFSGIGILLFAAMALLKRRRFFTAAQWGRLPIIRGLCEGFASIGFFIAIAHADLSLITAILMAMPIVVTAAAAIFLKEQVGWVRWTAVFIGFIGVLMIIRPTNMEIPPQALWILLSVAAIAVRDLITRQMDAALPPEIMSIQAYLATFVFGTLMLLLSSEPSRGPSGHELMLIVTGVTFGAFGYLAIIRSMQIGEPSAVSPFRYVRVVFAMILGVVVLGERPDQATLLGAAVIVLAGTIIALRENRARKSQ